jgi:hypothetical protein
MRVGSMHGDAEGKPGIAFDLPAANERKFLESSAFDYHASYSPDGRRVIFTHDGRIMWNSGMHGFRDEAAR